MPNLINWGLAKNPMNWITILLMVTIAGFVVRKIVDWEQSA